MTAEAAVAAARKIAGWSTEAELLWLARQAAKCESVVEVGSWQGRSTKALAGTCRGIVYAVDDFRGVRGDAAGELEQGELEREFRRNLAAELDAGKVELLRMASVEAAEQIGMVDLVFVDGSHEYSDVREDLLVWRPRARRLCGHDMGFPGVAAALEELLPSARCVVGSVWAER